jgi:hypothetical protein
MRRNTASASRRRALGTAPFRTAQNADRFLPDKGFDLVDEAASHLRLEIDSLRPKSSESSGHHATRNRTPGPLQGKGRKRPRNA